MNALKLTVLGYVKRAVNVRDDEVRVLLWAFAYFFCLLCAYYVLRPVRDAMGLAGGVRNLQWLFTATFLTMLIAVPIFGVVVAKFPRRKFLTWVYLFFIANILIFYFVFQQQLWKITSARVFFVWVSVFNLFIISVFWSFMADIFFNEQGNRLFGFIAAGGTVGALTGPMKTAIYLARFAAENYPLGLRNLTALAGGNFFSNLLFPTLP
jgi:AAA family ATP:ADP antiporter